MLVQPGLCRTCSETTLLVFPRGGSYVSSPSSVLVQYTLGPPLYTQEERVPDVYIKKFWSTCVLVPNYGRAANIQRAFHTRLVHATEEISHKIGTTHVAYTGVPKTCAKLVQLANCHSAPLRYIYLVPLP